jgi:hypothetical protein
MDPTKITFLGLPLDWAGVGAMITAAIAGIALLYAGKELRSARTHTAQDIYKEFLIRSLEHPEFICPEPEEVDPDRQLFGKNSDRFWRYEVYIDLLLTAFEQLFEIEGDNRQLENYIGGYLYSHEKYLQSEYFKQFIGEMDDAFWQFTVRAIAREKGKWTKKPA